MYKKIYSMFITTMIIAALSGCSSKSPEKDSLIKNDNNNTTAKATVDTTPLVDETCFTERDYEISYDDSAEKLELGDQDITITDEGTYILSGTLNNKRITVDAPDKKVQLVLSSCNIISDSSCPFVIKDANKVFITLADGTTNSISDGSSYSETIDESKIDAAIFTKSDITFNGKGTLNITGSYKHGIASKDDITITGGTYNINAKNVGIDGKDCVQIGGGTLNITAGTHGIRSGNSEDTEKGYVYIKEGVINIAAKNKGIKAMSQIIIDGAETTISESYEGLEALELIINDGSTSITSSDDGINAANKYTDKNNASPVLKVSGGTLNIDAYGDGIDSNGSFIMSEGTVYISGPENNGNGALDYDNSATISGGTLIAAGSSGMAQNFDDSSTQGSILVNFDTKNGETPVTLSDSNSNTLLTWTPQKSYSSVLISCPDLKTGCSYTITAGDYSETITLSELIYGKGNDMPGGKRHGGKMPDGQRPERPDGQRPERPDGQKPELPDDRKPEQS